MIDIVDLLLGAVKDPMWADHCEISKRVALEAAEEIQRLRFELANLKDSHHD